MNTPNTINLAAFAENPDNPQTVTDEAYALLVQSIRDTPQTLEAAKIAYCTDYVAVDGTDMAGRRVVIAGNKRLRALKEIYGAEADVPAAWFFDLTPLGEEARRRWLVKSNIQSGEWDAEKLLALYSEDELGALMGDDNLEDLLASIKTDTADGGMTDEDAAPDTPEETISKRGEIYQCGEHRLMCGDATIADDVAALMGGDRAHLVFTDPPYNVAIGSKNKAINEIEQGKGDRIEEDIAGDTGMSDEECGEKLWKPAFTAMRTVAADDCSIYVTMPQGGTHMMMMMMMASSWQVKHELIWLKDQPTFSMGRLDYDYKHEPICFGWNKTHNFYGKGQFTKSVWEYPKPRASKLHPTMKPVALIENALLNSSLAGDIILDPFGGSGTTMIACEQLGRKCRMMEIDPHYCDVIRKRWAEFAHGEGCDWEALTPQMEAREPRSRVTE